MSRILVVEDSRTQAEELRLILEADGFAVEVAPDGQRALDRFDSSGFDLVITDVLMPGLSGYEVCRTIKGHHSKGRVPVILLTMLSDPTAIAQGIEAGADYFIPKPYKAEDLVGRIRGLFANRVLRAQSRLKVGLEVVFLGKRLIVTSDKEQILDLLLSTCEEIVRTNRDLHASQEELRQARARLDEHNQILQGQAHSFEQRFRLLVEGVKDYAVFMLGPDGRVATWNSGAQRIKGYRAEEIIGKHFSCFSPDEDRARGKPDQELQAALAYGKYEGEGWRLRKDGSRFWANVVLTPLADNAGRHIGFAKVTRDVSEHKKLEEQLRQSQKMEAFGQLAGGVAHDFNNLLTIINGYSEILLDQLSAEAPEGRLVGEIHCAGQRAALLTRQLLAFSRKAVVEPEVLDLNAVVADLEKMLSRVIGEDINLATNLQAGLGRVKTDIGQIEQVVMNLVVNARDAMPQGGKLTIETRNVRLDEDYARSHAEVRPGRYVLLAISDTGHGMTEEVKARIFEPFFTTKEKGRGTGLGLATVFGIVKQSGGRVEVYSEPEVGTAFKVYLPRVEEAITPGKSHQGLRPTAGGNETILLVEDEDAVRALARIVLQSGGYTVLEAGDGNEATRVCEQHPGLMDLLVTDVVMPGLGGRQLAERLLTIHPEMKVLYLSGYTNDAVVRHGILHEEVNFLQKPFSTAALAHKVREVLDSPQLGTDMGSPP